MAVKSSFISVVLDKLYVISGLVVMTLFVAPIIYILYKPATEFITGYIVIICGLCAAYFSFLLSKYINKTAAFKNYLKQKEIFSGIVKYLLFDKVLISKCITITVASQIVSTTAFYILSLNADAHITYLQCLLLITPAQLITTIPVAFNGWGLREISIIYMLRLVDIAPDKSLVLSIQYGLIGVMLWSIGLLSWLFLRPNLTIKTDISQNVIE